MNKIILMGRLVKDISVQAYPSGGLVGKFTLAVEKDMTKDKKEEMKSAGKPTADFIRCIAFGKSADTISKWTSKGSRLLVEGALNTSSYEKDGERRYSTDVLVNRFNIIDFKERTTSETNSEYFDNFDGFESGFSDDGTDVHF